MIPIVAVLQNNAIKEATVCKNEEQQQAVFERFNRDYGRETNHHELQEGYVDLEDGVRICMFMANELYEYTIKTKHGSEVIDAETIEDAKEQYTEIVAGFNFESAYKDDWYFIYLDGYVEESG